ncbi:MAG: 3-deoxy-7-phosphoheptulonate synthase, partial [Selenomonadaceae bacterium]|nr:3-deoxy-7-phosphoheptulonate synthase [Selenomonadaceae bacterium]
MIIVMKPTATPENINNVVRKIENAGLRTHLSTGEEVTIVGVIGDKKLIANLEVNMLEG